MNIPCLQWPCMSHSPWHNMHSHRTVQPTASAGAFFRVIMLKGKFQGVMEAATPTGCFSTTMRLVGLVVCSTSPSTRLPCSANHSIEPVLHACSLFEVDCLMHASICACLDDTVLLLLLLLQSC